MRIVHADTDDLDHPLRGGQPVRTFAINARLAPRHDITVFTSTYRGARPEVVRQGVRYERLGITVPRWGLSSHLSFLARLPAAIRRTPHDLVVEEFAAPFGFCGSEKHTERPVVSIVQWFFFAQWTRRYRLPFEHMMRRRARHGKPRHLIVQTDCMGRYFRDLLPDARIDRVPCGIDDEAFQPPSVTGDFALYLGRLDIAQKGLDDLIDAWQRLARDGMAIPLRIVGTGPDEVALRARVRAHGLDAVVSFMGRLEGPAKREALRDCRFLVMPSREETFGLVALEAMASGKPVVACAIDHLDELLRPGWSASVRSGDVGALADAVATLWQQPERGLAMGRNAFDAAHAYRWDVLAAQQNDIYEDLAKTGRRT